ncbi:MAG: PorT family protein [Prevotella sp.]|nr:PorT family protein [Candidatus Prevotella equi]
MKKIYTLFIYIIAFVCSASAQRNEVVQNRPYTDLRPVHFGVVVGMSMQDMKFNNVGPQVLTLSDGTQQESLVTCDQTGWDIGFNVGVLAEFRINEYFAFRTAPQLYFGTRNLTFYNFNKEKTPGEPLTEVQSLRSVLVGANFDLIYAAKRHNNHRPYMMLGIAPMFNVSTPSNEYLQMKTADAYLEFGIGCDFYMPYFKLRPELKFMLGLTNCLNNKRADVMNDDAMLPYTKSVNKARSKIISLSFYFE